MGKLVVFAVLFLALVMLATAFPDPEPLADAAADPHRRGGGGHYPHRGGGGHYPHRGGGGHYPHRGGHYHG